jgi:hypothetical protein
MYVSLEANHWSMGNLPAATHSMKNDSSPSSQQLSTAPELGMEPSEPLSHQCSNVDWIDLVQVMIGPVSS